jgi:nitrate/nitrite-specific signal transduction histidine kinase
MMSQHDDTSSLNRAEDFLQLLNRGSEFAQGLLRENERLRFQVVKLEDALREQRRTAASAVPVDAAHLLEKLAELEWEKAEILARIHRVEEENQDFANRYVEIEAENQMLANLYLASHQLHATLDFNEVLQICMESIINLIGAEEFAILLLDEKTNRLEPVACEGLDLGLLPSIGRGEGIIGAAVNSGESYFIASLAGYRRDLLGPIACIPLKIKEHAIGVIVIYQLLTRKTQFSKVDCQLCALLAGHVATAVLSSRLYSASERKLSTIQGFINLLAK